MDFDMNYLVFISTVGAREEEERTEGKVLHFHESSKLRGKCPNDKIQRWAYQRQRDIETEVFI